MKSGSDGLEVEDSGELPNPFDPKRLRISQRFGEGLDVRVVIASVSVRKPHRQWWIRVHPDSLMAIETCVLHNEHDQQHYLVDPSLSPSLPGEGAAMALYTAITMSGGLFLWPIRLPNEDGQQHECHITAHHAAQMAKTNWIRISWDRPNSNYAVVCARGQVPEPAWPEVDLQKLLSIAFKDRFIDSLEHPVVRRLLGGVLMNACAHFTSTWIVICCAQSNPGGRLVPLHLAALDTDNSSEIAQIGVPKLLSYHRPPYPTGPQCLLITFDANELVGFHLALGWRAPERIVDLSVEFRNVANGRRLPCGDGLVGAMLWFGLTATGAVGRYDTPAATRRRVDAVTRLFEAMWPSLDLGRALLRGRYMAAVARMEAVGVPFDQHEVETLACAWPAIREDIVKHVDQQFGVYESGRLQLEAFESWLARRGIAWPRKSDGHIELSDNTFRDMARAHSELRPLKDLRTTLSGFDPGALAIGRDGRNRVPIRPFASRTGRNQPSSSASLLGSAAWVRHLIRPAPGMGLALIDWSQQEFGIAAALSEDPAMMAAYATGDPYLALAMRAGVAPPGATCASHSDIREMFKACALGVQYGMRPATLARLTQLSEVKAQQLISWHRAAFPSFWCWSDAIEAQSLFTRQIRSVFGWRISIGENVNSRFLRNFPMQANGAEMLRLACCLATESGIKVCFPQHDALLIEASLKDLDAAIATTERLMAEASRVVLAGFELRSKARAIRHPDRLRDTRGETIWRAVEHALAEIHTTAGFTRPARQRHAAGAHKSTRPIYLYGFKRQVTDASD